MTGARREPLSLDRIVAAAATVADDGGLAQVTMRNVAKSLGVEAMSLYHHVANKDALLDALVEWIFGQVELPSSEKRWRPAMAARAASARAVMAAHPWGLGLIESRRKPGPNLLTHHDAVIGCLRDSGFSVELAAHAFSVIDAYIYGFVLTETNLPFEADEGAAGFVEEIDHLMDATAYPHLVELVTAKVVGGDYDYDYGDEFDFGLDLILDGIEARFDERPG